MGEFSANHYRKDWTISEMVAIKRAIEPYEKKKVKEKLKEIGRLFERGKDNKKIGSADSSKPIETREIVAVIMIICNNKNYLEEGKKV